MFINKDLRKIPTIFEESSSKGDGLDKLQLAKRQSEFGGNLKILCQPSHANALQSLSSLSLYDCAIQDLTGISMMPNLEDLSLGRNPLRAIPDELSSLKQLKSLWLDDCRLVGPLPTPLMELSQLQELRLSNNAIDQLPDDIGHKLPQLRVLALDNNRLTALPDSVAMLEHLTTLQVRKNQLTRLGHLPSSLKMLQVSSNQLVELDESIVECRHLTHIYANANRLCRLPDQLGLLTSLERLNVGHNQITELSADFTLTFGKPSPDGLSRGKTGCVVVLTANPVLNLVDEEEEDDLMEIDQPPNAMVTA